MPIASEQGEGTENEAAGGSRRSRPLALLASFFLLMLLLDGLRPPAEQWGVRAAMAGIHLYRATLSPFLSASGVNCRMRPSCSHYAEGALEARGLVPGAVWTVRRLLRCGPWTAAGTEDPPPGPALHHRREMPKVEERNGEER